MHSPPRPETPAVSLARLEATAGLLDELARAVMDCGVQLDGSTKLGRSVRRDGLRSGLNRLLIRHLHRCTLSRVGGTEGEDHLLGGCTPAAETALAGDLGLAGLSYASFGVAARVGAAQRAAAARLASLQCWPSAGTVFCEQRGGRVVITYSSSAGASEVERGSPCEGVRFHVDARGACTATTEIEAGLLLRLKERYDRGPFGDPVLFYERVFCLIVRYEALTLSAAASGFQGAMPDGLVQSLAAAGMPVAFEAFASPLNVSSGVSSYCSLYPDDAFFGACGSFLEHHPSPAPGAGLLVCEVNPPFVLELLNAAVAHVLRLLDEGEEKKRSEVLTRAPVFLLLVPCWRGAEFLDALEGSRYKRHRTIVEQGGHVYKSGVAHRGGVEQQPAFFTTVLYLCAPDAAGEHLPAEDLLRAAVLRGFRGDGSGPGAPSTPCSS